VEESQGLSQEKQSTLLRQRVFSHLIDSKATGMSKQAFCTKVSAVLVSVWLHGLMRVALEREQCVVHVKQIRIPFPTDQSLATVFFVKPRAWG